jgi:cysteine-rich repeat protein
MRPPLVGRHLGQLLVALVLLGGLGWATSSLLSACSDLRTFDAPGGIVIYDAGSAGSPDGGVRQNRPVMTGEIAPIYGFASPDAIVEYYYLGEVDRVNGEVPVNKIYFFYDEDGEPLFRLADDGARLVGWHPVVGTIPTRPGASPFWRVHHVRVKGKVNVAALDALRATIPTAEICQMDATCTGGKRCIEERCRAPIQVGVFDLDGIKSEETLVASKLLVWDTEQIVTCPIVDADAKLLKGLTRPDAPYPKVQLWFQRLKAYCQLADGGHAVLGTRAPALPSGGPPPVADAYFLRQELSFGTAEPTPVLPKRYLVLTENLPGSAGYSPLVRELDVTVDKDYRFKDLRSVADIKSKGLKVTTTDKLHLLSVRGLIPSCVSDDDCAGTGGKVDPPLKCSIEQGYCSPPFARLYEECRRGVKECDPKGGAGGTRLVCVGWQGREKYFCYNACDSGTKDTDPDPDIDSRCGAVKDYHCHALRQTDPTRPNGLCLKDCNSRAGDAAALIAECESPTCGNGKLEFGETCDDGNKVDRDGCDRFCQLSTYERCDQNSDCKGASQTCAEPVFGQGSTYCLPAATKEKDESVDNGKYRLTCADWDYCVPPDVRADWLGKTEGQP